MRHDSDTGHWTGTASALTKPVPRPKLHDHCRDGEGSGRDSPERRATNATDESPLTPPFSGDPHDPPSDY